MKTQVTSVDGGALARTPSMAVVVAVANAKGIDPLELEPLGDVVDTEALDRLFAGAGESRMNGWLTFRMAGCEVTVTSDGELSVTPDLVNEPEAEIQGRGDATTADW